MNASGVGFLRKPALRDYDPMIDRQIDTREGNQGRKEGVIARGGGRRGGRRKGHTRLGSFGGSGHMWPEQAHWSVGHL